MIKDNAPKKRDLAMLVDYQFKSFLTHRPSLLVIAVSIFVTTVAFFMIQELESLRLNNELQQISNGAITVFIIGVLLGFLLAFYIFSFERNRIREIMVTLSLTDELTQLYNRRGLWLLTDEQIKLSLRHKRGFWLLIMDMDRLKEINDSFGHPEGDRAIKAVAALLQETFRKADIISRIGGDEFAVAALEATHTSLVSIMSNLRSQIEKCNSTNNQAYKIQISIGAAYFNPASPCTIDELMARADKELYAEKNAHHARESRA